MIKYKKKEFLTLESSAFKSDIFPFFGQATRTRMGVMDASHQKKMTLTSRFFGTGTGTERHMYGSKVMLTRLHPSSGHTSVDLS